METALARCLWDKNFEFASYGSSAMHKHLRSPYAILIALMALVGSTALLNVAKSEDPKGHAADVQAIKKAGAAYTAAFEKGDIEGLLSHWAPDAEYIDETGKTIQGREAI